MSRWPPKNSEAKLNANTKPVINGEMAMTVAQADAVLAKFGYVEKNAELLTT